MSDHRFILDPGPTKFMCPKCNQQRFVLFIDKHNNAYAGEKYGRCDREQKCGHFELPPLQTKTYFVPFQHMIDYNEKSYKLLVDHKPYYLPKSQVFEILPNGCYASAFILENSKKPPQYHSSDTKIFDNNRVAQVPVKMIPVTPPEPSFIDNEIMSKSLGAFESNALVSFLISKLGEVKTSDICKKYNIGTTKSGATIFWQVDDMGRVRSGKVIHYLDDGHRNKTIAPSWSHSKLKLKDFNLLQCLFGLHLVHTNATKPICIVESEKTAIISAAYFPEYIWMACGGKSNLSAQKLSIIKDRHIIFWPDLAAFEDWSKISKKLNENGFSIKISDFLESNTSKTDKEQGLDLADYLLQFPIPSDAMNENCETSDAQKTTFLFELSHEPHPMNIDWFRNLADFDARLIVHLNNESLPIHSLIKTHVKQVKLAKNIASYNLLCKLQQALFSFIYAYPSHSGNSCLDIFLE